MTPPQTNTPSLTPTQTLTPTTPAPPTPTQTLAPTDTQTPIPTPTPVLVVLEDFEAGWNAEWWHSEVPPVMEFQETNEKAHDSNQSLKVTYTKTNTYQFLGADYTETDKANFRGASALQVWVYGNVNLLLKIEGSKGSSDASIQTADNATGWTLLTYSLVGMDERVGLDSVKLLFFPAPGVSPVDENMPDSPIVFYLDDIVLVMDE
jgi:hypothetical protein